VTEVESSDLYVESTEFLDAWFASELGTFTSAVASYFLDKTYFYSHYREGEQETDMMACGWYSDLMDTQAKLLKICDALCVDRERLIKLFRLLKRWEQVHPETSFPLQCHLEAIKRYLIEKPLTQSAYAAERLQIRTQNFCAKECFLNLYTYPETLGLCIYACCTCAEEYTVPGLELTAQLCDIPEGCIALRDDEEVSGILDSFRTAGIVTEVLRHASEARGIFAICRYDKGVLSRFTHINRSFLDLRGSCSTVDPNTSY